MEDGTRLRAKRVVSGAGPYHTFLELLPGYDGAGAGAGGAAAAEDGPLPTSFARHVRFADHACGAFKINLAVSRLPEFACWPNPSPGVPGPQHRGTVHLESRMEELENAFREASMGVPASRPVIEMTIPSALDATIAPPGQHVVQLVVQYAPYDVDPKVGHWADGRLRHEFADRCVRIVEEFCPGFADSIVGRDVLSPLDLEREFGLHRGNIFHGSLALHQLAYARPMAGHSDHRSPLRGLYMASAGTHPGGGVMGACGRNCALAVLDDVRAGR
jgi:phytoene dehydrogenase-like protein